MAMPPGTIEEWVEVEPNRWQREDLITTLNEGMTFAEFWQLRLDREVEGQNEINRVAVIVGDTLRAEYVALLNNGSNSQIEAFVRTKLNADAVTDLASARPFCKRVETAFVILMKTIALQIKE